MIAVNLISTAEQTARAQQHHARRWAIAVAISVIAVGVPVVLDTIDRARAVELRETEGKLSGLLASSHGELQNRRAEAAELLAQQERADALRNKRSWSNMLILIGTCLPDQTWLTYVGTDPETARTMPSTRTAAPRNKGDEEADAPKEVVRIDAPTKLRLKGLAPDHGELYQFMAQLKAANVFAGVTLIRSGMEPAGEDEIVAFELLCEW